MSTVDVTDIYPRTPVRSLKTDFSAEDLACEFDEALVASLLGMRTGYIRKAIDVRPSGKVRLLDVLTLLEMDAYAETYVPRSKIPDYLLGRSEREIPGSPTRLDISKSHTLVLGNALELVRMLPERTVQCVVTSTPYWATRLYDTHFAVQWADGDCCPFGHEQTPEGFIRHSVEILYELQRVLTQTGSIWWNLMDTYNTRTQIRASASETLNAMKGNDPRGWGDHASRRYSAGHSYLEDGEQCLIPQRVAERASRLGYWVKSMITWKKNGSMPETVTTRVTREIEYIIHLSRQRSPDFDKSQYLKLAPEFGGRNLELEAEKLTDIWAFPTTTGTNGHGAQFSLALPARCIALTTKENELVLDPFVGGGTTCIAAAKMGRRSVGFDVSAKYLQIAEDAISRAEASTASSQSYGAVDRSAPLQPMLLNDATISTSE